MLHVFRLGPLPVGGRDAYAYAGIDDQGLLAPPAFAHTDAEGLAEIAKRSPGRHRCEPALAEAGRPLGFDPAELPCEALEPRALLAHWLVFGGDEAPPVELQLRFFRACARFWRAEPWRFVGSEDPLPVKLADDRGRRAREGSVMGGGGQEFGLALYDEPGSIDRVVAAVERGRPQDAVRVPAVAVTFDDEPGWVAAAFADAFGIPRAPVPMRTRGKAAGQPTPDELLALTAALEAIAALAESDDLDPSEATVEASGMQMTARVALPEAELDDDGDAFEPMLVPQPARRSERTPRNAPCPCGSGRKYKKCHLAEDDERERAARGAGLDAELAPSEQRRLAERDPIHAREERITGEALALARKRWKRAFDPEGALRAAGLGDEAIHHLPGWCAGHHRGPDGRTALELWLEERGGTLDDEGRRLTAALRRAWFSLHEVVAAAPGESLTLRDLLAGGERVVADRTASRMLVPRTVLLARVVALGDRAILAGCHPQPLPPLLGDTALRAARAHLNARGKVVRPARLRELSAEPALFATWQLTCDAAANAPAPRLRNTDGDALLLTVDRLDLAAGAAKETMARLLTVPGAQPGAEGGGSAEVVFVRQDGDSPVEATLVGRATIEGDLLRLETNSLARADRLRRLVEERLGALAAFRVRTHEDPEPALARAAGRGSARGAPLPPERLPPEAHALVRQLKTEHYRKWMEEPVPALGGRTPRAAAAGDAKARDRLRVLLAELEFHEARAPAEQRIELAWLRAELGMA